jgi:hypothetical protein
MPSAKDAKILDAVAFVEPKEAQVAITAEPGALEKWKAEAAKTAENAIDSVQAKGGGGSGAAGGGGDAAGEEENPKKLTWIGIELVDETSGKPVPYARYIAKVGSQMFDGTLDQDGKAKIEGIEDGSAEVQFPDIHGDEWFKF